MKIYSLSNKKRIEIIDKRLNNFKLTFYDLELTLLIQEALNRSEKVINDTKTQMEAMEKSFNVLIKTKKDIELISETIVNNETVAITLQKSKKIKKEV